MKVSVQIEQKVCLFLTTDSDGDEDLTEDKRAKKSSLALKKMGNISRKPLNSMPPSTSLMLESYYW